MKALLTLITLFTALNGFSSTGPSNSKNFKFSYSAGKQIFEVQTTAANRDAAFKIAAKECFQKLTGGKYPGEDRGMDIIDICANPKM